MPLNRANHCVNRANHCVNHRWLQWVDSRPKRSPSIPAHCSSATSPPASYERASDEHGRLGIAGTTDHFRISNKIRLISGHCDPTVNLYDWHVCVRGARVEQPRPITARGAVY
jgi:D-serine deaminase-like pyridoxal phosphate-dependent protein